MLDSHRRSDNYLTKVKRGSKIDQLRQKGLDDRNPKEQARRRSLLALHFPILLPLVFLTTRINSSDKRCLQKMSLQPYVNSKFRDVVYVL